jgi:hypothetical protein
VRISWGNGQSGALAFNPNAALPREVIAQGLPLEAVSDPDGLSQCCDVGLFSAHVGQMSFGIMASAEKQRCELLMSCLFSSRKANSRGQKATSAHEGKGLTEI